jgi:hypothetical protein
MSIQEPGYKAVLVREETKQRLKNLRKMMPERDLCQERRLATAAMEIVLDQAEGNEKIRSQLIGKVREVVARDISAAPAV